MTTSTHFLVPKEAAMPSPLGELLQALCGWGLYWAGKTGARILAFERGTEGSQTA